MSSRHVRVGLYGTNGHQLLKHLAGHAGARLVATAAVPREELAPALRDDDSIRRYDTLDGLMDDPGVELVSLCSPRRRDQAADAIRCLEHGKHVYAEKPCAMCEADLDAVMAAAQRTGLQFHEMAGTAFEEPYRSVRELVLGGGVGTVVQVLAQKSYPYHARRPQDEDMDGGLILQVGVHAARFVEHVAGVRIADIAAVQTGLSNPAPGGLQMAASLIMTLVNGGVASVIANYLNPPAFPAWGNDHLRIFGTRGFVEIVDGGARTRLVLNERDCGPLPVVSPGEGFFEMVVDSIRGKAPLPLSLDEELHPTRMVIRGRESAMARALRRSMLDVQFFRSISPASIGPQRG